ATGLTIRVWGGVSYNTIDYFSPDNFSGATWAKTANNISYTSVIQPFFGAGIQFPRRESKPIGVGIDLMYRSSGPFTGDNGVNEFLSERLDYNASFSYLAFMPSARYYFGQGPVYAKAGLGLTFILNSTSSVTSTTSGFPAAPKTYNLLNLNSLGYNISLGAGM